MLKICGRGIMGNRTISEVVVVKRLLAELACLTVLFFLHTNCVKEFDARKPADPDTDPSPLPTLTPTVPPLPPVPPAPPAPAPPPPDDGHPFTSEWDIQNIEGELKLVLPLPQGYSYDFTVDWGDKSNAHISTWNDRDATHIYKEAGKYTVKIRGRLEAWNFQKLSTSRDQLIAVTNLGSVGWRDLSGAFYECDFLTNVAVSNGEFIRGVTSMASMFAGADKVNPDVSNWETTAVTDMSSMFENTGSAAPDVSNWDTANVTTMAAMFESAAAVNAVDVSEWDTANVTTMARMFANAGTEGSMDKSPYLVQWDFAKVSSMEGMLIGQTLPTKSYSDLLEKIAEGTVMKNVYFDAGNSKFNIEGANAKSKLSGEFGWVIYDGGADIAQ